ncbi:PAS domain S-box protein [Flavobacterium sp.]|uniref:PAS domain S-box protein n=1 Tax=Flavobacterium sp. TaxID=239 RepID=UPI0026194DA3|nr:PAS domain S-box protein [Flavobacterium sp.]
MDRYTGIFNDPEDSATDDRHISLIKEEYFSRLMEFLPAVIYTCDAQGKITYYNKAASAFWGFSPEIGTDLYFTGWRAYTIEGQPLPSDQTPMAKTLQYGKPFTEEIILENAQGLKRYIQPLPKPIFNTSGTLIGVLNMHIDITQRYQLRMQALENERKQELYNKKVQSRYEKMIDEVQDYAIIMLDKEGNIISWNKGAEKIKGYTADEITGKNFREFYFQNDLENKLPDMLIEEAFLKGRVVHEGWRRRKDNSRFWASVVITAVHDDEDNVVGFTKVTRDLTERKLSEERIKQYTTELEQKNKALEQYASIASHDLQEPIRKVEVFTGMLKSKINSPEAASVYADKITDATQRMSKLIKEILQYTRTTAESLFEDINLNATLHNVITDMELIINDKNAVINNSGLPEIKGISIQLYQLFYNLISNSIKFNDSTPVIDIFSEDAPVAEIAAFKQLQQDISYYKFTIRDNGRGFDNKYSERIFEMFERLDNSAKGTGIGLALCRKIVENHHGHITAISRENSGTDVLIYLPK